MVIPFNRLIETASQSWAKLVAEPEPEPTEDLPVKEFTPEEYLHRWVEDTTIAITRYAHYEGGTIKLTPLRVGKCGETVELHALFTGPEVYIDSLERLSFIYSRPLGIIRPGIDHSQDIKIKTAGMSNTLIYQAVLDIAKNFIQDSIQEK